jgi:hypothetical protein
MVLLGITNNYSITVNRLNPLSLHSSAKEGGFVLGGVMRT